VSNKQDEYGLIRYDFEAISPLSGNYGFNEIEKIKNTMISRIRNAWNRGGFFDGRGNIWLLSSELHNILCTNIPNSRYLVGSLSQSDKYSEYNNENQWVTYIRGSSVQYLLDKMICDAGSIQREHHLRLSECFYKGARDSDHARLLRAEFYESRKNTQRNLKSNRLQQYRLRYDELTGYDLDVDCEFSHIRAVSIFPEFSLYVENGLLVNKDTHNEITRNGIIDENQLYTLCLEKDWNLGWYEIFSDFLKKF
jgi:hypothetical protein